jgi:hypothetical protein
MMLVFGCSDGFARALDLSRGATRTEDAVDRANSPTKGGDRRGLAPGLVVLPIPFTCNQIL